MTAACALPTVDDLAQVLCQKYAAGIRGLMKRAGWQKAEIRGAAWLAARDALSNYDERKGDLVARGWFYLKLQALESGFVPARARSANNDEGTGELDQVEGGDDPAAILEAVQQISHLIEAAAAIENHANGMSERTKRRWRAQARGAAQQLLAGGAASQGELF